jgi:hypothetical protein
MEAEHNAAIHELVAAFCSGGGVGAIDTAGFLEPPGVTTPGKTSFRRPSGATGVVVGSPTGPVIGSSPAAKFPEGTAVIGLDVSSSDHPSAERCPNAQTLP